MCPTLARPECEDLRLRVRVAFLIRAAPVAVFQRAMETMVLPLLLSLSDLMPTLFPREWVWSPPEQWCSPPSALASPRRLFLELCMVSAVACRRAAEDQAPVDMRHLVDDMVVGGSSLHEWLLSRRRFLRRRGHHFTRGRLGCVRACIERIAAQIESIRGRDVIFHRLYSQVREVDCGGQRASCSPVEMCRFACSLGLVEHTAQLALRIRDECRIGAPGRMYLNALLLRLQAVIAWEQGARLAVAMALHPRLGASSGLACLASDLLLLCLPPSVQCEPIVSWSSVLLGCDIRV